MWKKLKKYSWENRGIWITAPSVAGAVIFLRFLGLLQGWEWAVYDQFLRMRPQEDTDQRIAIVGIDENDVSNFGQSTFTDEVYADLLAKLRSQQPRAIGLDIYRDIPIPPGHEELVEIFQTTPNLIGIQKVAGEQGRETVAPPPALKEKGQVGANDVIIDADGKIRRGLIYLTAEDGEIVYSFAIHLALLYLQVEEIYPEIVGENEDTWRLGKSIFSPFSAYYGGYVRADDSGYQLPINYRGGSRTFETVSLTDVLEGNIPPDWAKDRIILIGNISESFNDLFDTPYSNGLLTSPERVAGVEIHANLTSQLISSALDGRTLIKSWSQPAEWLWIIGWATVGAVLSWRLRHQGGTHLSWQIIVMPLFAGFTLGSICFFSLYLGWWIPVVPPFLAMIGSVAAITTYVARTAGDIRKTFGRYLSDSVVANLLESPEGLKLGGERRKITILTSDLRGFTATSERLSPEEVVRILNLYLGEMAEVITQYQGTIDEFMGDGILVLFGAPTFCPDDAERAVACAVAMQEAMTKVNEKMIEVQLPKLQMGIGINTGEVVVGNIGSEKRTKYGVVGSQVNLTYRIESYTTSGQILISQSTLKEAGSLVEVYGYKEVKPKGVKEPIKIYDVAGIGGKYNLFLKQEEEIFLPLEEELSLLYSILDGKDISDTLFEGRIREISAQGAWVKQELLSSETLPLPLTNIKLNFLYQKDLAQQSDDIYAKIVEKDSREETGFYIYFTSKSPEIEVMLDNLYQSLLKTQKGS